MPRGDRTGRFGYGPFSGRGMGYCAGFDRPGYMNNFRPRGRGYMGMGYGLGPARGFYPYYEPHYIQGDEKEFLASQAKVLQDQLDDIKKRLEDLAKQED